MNRTSTNEIVISLGLLLLAAALLFAWTGSRARSTPEAVDQAQRPAADRADKTFDWETIGEQTYQSSCASCHAEGEATRRVPPLRGHIPNLFLAPGGREYLIDFTLFGLEGRIEVGEAVYDGRHPIYKNRLSDEEIAAALNFALVSWGNRERLPTDIKLYGPEDAAARRDLEFSREQMQQTRSQLILPQ